MINFPHREMGQPFLILDRNGYCTTKALERDLVPWLCVDVEEEQAYSNGARSAGHFPIFSLRGKHHLALPPSEMKDSEQGYDLHASPKLENLQDGDKKVPSHPSLWLLLAISMPRMAIQMAWTAQWAALGPYLSTMLPRVGVFSDRSTMKMGRRRPFLIVAGALSIICWIAMGYTREMGEALGDHGDGQGCS
ncbi:hypothetical protein GN958_ATG18002 [Phytophthora infestans]|uniref:Uncharacterized protein n=1 Tax=Phytophthora infestans TaxID=4787 RepID=A0A8S9TVM1_PHYIN|nr:hypothetical protein GN958_ATG18002 [Phytophthora infestans]